MSGKKGGSCVTDSAKDVKDHIDIGHAAILDAVQHPGHKADGKAFESMTAPESWHNHIFRNISDGRNPERLDIFWGGGGWRYD
jgi:hypothetical protein